MSRNLTVPYSYGADKKLRPYLWLAVTGPYGGNEIAISGLVDTGADRSVLPIEYAKTLGYRINDLVPVEGSLSAWEGEKIG